MFTDHIKEGAELVRMDQPGRGGNTVTVAVLCWECAYRNNGAQAQPEAQRNITLMTHWRRYREGRQNLSLQGVYHACEACGALRYFLTGYRSEWVCL